MKGDYANKKSYWSIFNNCHLGSKFKHSALRQPYPPSKTVSLNCVICCLYEKRE